MTIIKPFRTCMRAVCAATLLVSATTRADELQLLWEQSPDLGVPYLSSTANSERGLAYNPATGHLLVVSRASSGGDIYILNAETGEYLANLSLGFEGIVSGGTFMLNEIGVTSDGVIYAANLTTSTANPQFRIYRWENETADPTLAYEGDPSGDASAPRWGDSFAVRGSGTNTQIVAGAGSGASLGAIFTTEDGLTFTPTKITNVSANEVAFGSGNTIWAMRSGGTLRVIEFDLAAGTGTVRQTIPSTAVPTTVIPIDVDVENNLLGGISIQGGADALRLYDFSDTNNIIIVDQEVFPADNANANAVGAVDVHNDLVFAVDANNGLIAYRIIETVSPPVFQSQPPAEVTVLEGGPLSLVANVSGTLPITYTWQLDGENVPGASGSTLTIANVALTDAGTYTLVATNSAQSVTSNPVVVTVQEVVNSDLASVLWRKAPGELPFLGISNLERGIAYNAVSNHVVVVSRADGVKMHVLDGDTGDYLWEMQTPTDVIPTGASTPGGFRLNMVGVADDGAVYAANLTTGAGEGEANAVRIYRWENTGSNAVPVQVYFGAPAPGRRFGDTLDVRGSGNDTQILFGNNNSGAAEVDNTTVIMTTTDGGLSWTPNIITTFGVDDDYFRLGIGFGDGNTIWGKTSGQALYLVEFDLGTGIGTLLQTFTDVPLTGTAVAGRSNLVAVLTLENPDNVRFYELSGAGDAVTLVDQELFLVKNGNANGTGSIDFGGDRVYALDTNNGILAMRLGGGGSTQDPATFGSVSGTGTSLTFTVTGTPNATYQLEGTSDFETWTNVQTLNIEGDGSNEVTIANNGDYRFYRAVAAE